MTTTPITTAAVPEATSTSQTRAFQIAWGLAMCFYFLEYASRSAPAVMIPELTQAFGTTALGVSAILGTYYYTYSVTSLIAGAALDRLGAKKAVPVGIFILAVGCLVFSIGTIDAGYAGRLLQGAGSAFAFTGAVYLAVHGFSARWLATAIGVTQCVGMLGGSAGQFVVGPWLEGGLGWQTVWHWLGMPNDLALTYNEDQNLMVGVPYTRAAEFRAAYHLNEHWAMGVGIEDPNQYIGNYVALPSAFTSVGSQFDNNANPGAANLMPDILSKVTYDRDFSGRHFHAELTGLLTGAHASVMPIGSTAFRTHSVFGGGGQIAANYDLVPHKLVVLGNAFWSDGGAHYLVATGPQLVIRPTHAGNDVSLSMVHAGAGSAGLEWRATPQNAFAVYYGADYFGRNFFPDTTNTMHPGTIIGFGGPGSPNTNNRAIQQATFDWVSTFWRNPRHGALQAYTQYSYLTRAPWYVAPGTPKNAHLSMVYVGLRYVLPTTSGTLSQVPRPD